MEKYYITSNKYSTRERITKTNGKVYDIIFRVVCIDGTEKQKWLRGYKTKSLAKDAYLRFVQEYCEFVKNAPKKKKDPDKDVLLVGDLIMQYMATLGNQNRTSVIYDKENIFRLYILPKYKNTPIEKLNKSELYQWQDELWTTRNPRTNEYLSYKYLTKIRGLFNTFLSWCEQRYGYKNYFSEVKKPKRQTPKKTMQFWSKEQFDTFILNVTDPTYHALFTFMFYTGRRKGELFALHKTDVKSDKITFDKSVNRRNFGKEKWEITSTKTNKTCTIPVCKIVQDEIKKYKPPEDGLFYFGGKEPLPPTTVERVFKKYVLQAGLPMIRIHDLRHSFVSMVISKGGSFLVAAELISDTVEMVTRTYAHLFRDDMMSILARLC